jgi:hypothetical protein
MSCNGLYRFLGKGAARLSLTFLLLSGIIYATPITSAAESQLQKGKQPASRGFALEITKAIEPVTAEATPAPLLDTGTYAQASLAACNFSRDCSSTVEVPEPQSLIMVGTGLLSMAGLIRRRLLR